jgi:hypothetical protein
MISFTRKLVAGVLTAAALSPFIGACSDLEVHAIYTALDGSGNRRRTVFYTDTESIFCDIEYGSTREDITFNAVVRQIKDANGAGVNIIGRVGEIAPGISHGTLSFELSHPVPNPTQPMMNAPSVLPYPVGTFLCEIYVDALDPKSGVNSSQTHAPEMTTQFEIRFPDCPVSFAADGIVCKDFYRDKQVCPSAVKAISCTCDYATTTWKCAP